MSRVNARASATIYLGASDKICDKIESKEISEKEEQDFIETVFEAVCEYFDDVDDPELDEGYFEAGDLYLSVRGRIPLKIDSAPATRDDPGYYDEEALGSFDISEEEFKKIVATTEEQYPKYKGWLTGSGRVNENTDYDYDSSDIYEDGPDPDRDYDDMGWGR